MRQLTAAVLIAALLACTPSLRRGAGSLSPEISGDLSHSVIQMVQPGIITDLPAGSAWTGGGGTMIS